MRRNVKLTRGPHGRDSFAIPCFQCRCVSPLINKRLPDASRRRTGLASLLVLCFRSQRALLSQAERRDHGSCAKLRLVVAVESHAVAIVTVVVDEHAVERGRGRDFDPSLHVMQKVGPRQRGQRDAGVTVVAARIAVPRGQARLPILLWPTRRRCPVAKVCRRSADAGSRRESAPAPDSPGSRLPHPESESSEDDRRLRTNPTSRRLCVQRIESGPIVSSKAETREERTGTGETIPGSSRQDPKSRKGRRMVNPPPLGFHPTRTKVSSRLELRVDVAEQAW